MKTETVRPRDQFTESCWDLIRVAREKLAREWVEGATLARGDAGREYTLRVDAGRIRASIYIGDVGYRHGPSLQRPFDRPKRHVDELADALGLQPMGAWRYGPGCITRFFSA